MRIRIPRKLKKYKYGIDYPYKFPYVPKLDRYLSYLDIKWSMKYYKMTSEQFWTENLLSQINNENRNKR